MTRLVTPEKLFPDDGKTLCKTARTEPKTLLRPWQISHLSHW